MRGEGKRVVLDTNIIVSAALSPKGNPARILALIAKNTEIQLYYSTEIFDEYIDVLSRKQLKILENKQKTAIEIIQRVGILIEPTASNFPMTDETDRIFYDTAKHSGSILITGNLKHYPAEPFIMSPSDFLNHIAGVL